MNKIPEKIISLFQKLPIDQQIETFNHLKEVLTGELVKAAQSHEEAQGKLLSIKDKINNGK